MTNVALVAIELEQEGEMFQFHIGVLSKHAVAIQFLVHDVREEALRDQCDFQITLNLQATPLANGYVKAKTGTNTTDDVYNKWYDAVYEPQAEAVDTEDTSHTEEPQG